MKLKVFIPLKGALPQLGSKIMVSRLKRGSFSSAVWTNKGVNLAPSNFQIGVGYCRKALKGLPKIEAPCMAKTLKGPEGFKGDLVYW